MTNAYSLREHFTLGNYNTTITRAEFEHSFTKTKENVTVTFNGWDGKSYDGESSSARVLRSNIPGYEDVRFIKVGKSIHYLMEETLSIEKATGAIYPEASWLVDVERA